MTWPESLGTEVLLCIISINLTAEAVGNARICSKPLLTFIQHSLSHNLNFLEHIFRVEAKTGKTSGFKPLSWPHWSRASAPGCSLGLTREPCSLLWRMVGLVHTAWSAFLLQGQQAEDHRQSSAALVLTPAPNKPAPGKKAEDSALLCALLNCRTEWHTVRWVCSFDQRN